MQQYLIANGHYAQGNFLNIRTNKRRSHNIHVEGKSYLNALHEVRARGRWPVREWSMHFLHDYFVKHTEHVRARIVHTVFTFTCIQSQWLISKSILHCLRVLVRSYVQWNLYAWCLRPIQPVMLLHVTFLTDESDKKNQLVILSYKNDNKVLMDYSEGPITYLLWMRLGSSGWIIFLVQLV